MAPPINPNVEGLSLTNKNAQIGPRTDSDNIIIPTIADGVLRAPIVIKINPKPTWKKPARNPKKISCEEIINLFESKNPIKHELIPAINCAGTISTSGNFLIIIINTANVMGIVNAAKLPESSPGDNEFPTIRKTPETAKIIEVNVIAEIFSFSGSNEPILNSSNGLEIPPNAFRFLDNSENISASLIRNGDYPNMFGVIAYELIDNQIVPNDFNFFLKFTDLLLSRIQT